MHIHTFPLLFQCFKPHYKRTDRRAIGSVFGSCLSRAVVNAHTCIKTLLFQCFQPHYKRTDRRAIDFVCGSRLSRAVGSLTSCCLGSTRLPGTTSRWRWSVVVDRVGTTEKGRNPVRHLSPLNTSRHRHIYTQVLLSFFVNFYNSFVLPFAYMYCRSYLSVFPSHLH